MIGMCLGIDRLAVDPHLAWPFLDAGDVDDRQLHGVANLLRRQADAMCMTHRVKEIGNECAHRRRDRADQLAFRAQDRRIVMDDFADHGFASAGLAFM
jgi:hypothetical protein